MLWERVFRETPVPKTYDEFLDAMLLWESKYAELYPELDFAGEFDHVFWVRTVVNAFSMQYGNEEEFPNYKDERLKNLLKKLEFICEKRAFNGMPVRFSDNEEVFIPKADIFILGGHNVLQDPNALRPLESFEQDDIVVEGVYTPIPSLVFSKEEEPFVSADMVVWFVNPFSTNKNIAMRYLEHAAKKENTLLTYYATHKNSTKPVENKGYQSKLKDLQSQKEELNKLLANADETEQANIKNSIEQVQIRIDNMPFERWKISENAINIYRSFAPMIRFFEDNPYVLSAGSRMSLQLESLFERYSDKNISLDMFLDELYNKMQIMYTENQ
ncbi:MAG: hypothetical protein ACOYIT_06500 [Christensenellales bacterium]